MNKVKKIMFVMVASLTTMSLFSFKNAGVNEASFKNAQVTTYVANDAHASQPVAFTGAIIRAVVKTWQKTTRDIVYVTTAITQLGVENEYTANEDSIKSKTLLAKL